MPCPRSRGGAACAIPPGCRAKRGPTCCFKGREGWTRSGQPCRLRLTAALLLPQLWLLLVGGGGGGWRGAGGPAGGRACLGGLTPSHLASTVIFFGSGFCTAGDPAGRAGTRQPSAEGQGRGRQGVGLASGMRRRAACAQLPPRAPSSTIPPPSSWDQQGLPTAWRGGIRQQLLGAPPAPPSWARPP